MNLLERIRRLEEQVRANRVTDGIGYRRRTSAGGTSLELDLVGGGGARIALFRLKSVQDDYLTCRAWDGTTEGALDLYIAKPPKLRHSITTETLEGVQYDYTYSSGPDSLNKYRIAKVHGQSAEYERDLVTPEWLANDLIYAVSADTLIVTGSETPAPGTKVSLLLLNVDARAWAKHA